MEYKIKASKLIKGMGIESGKGDIKRDIYEEGFRAGFAEGKRVSREEMKLLVDAIFEEKRNFVKSLEPTILRLVQSIAQKVIAKEIKTDPSIVLESVREVLNRVVNPEKVLLKVNPHELKSVESLREKWASLLPSSELQIIGDDKISPGGCVLETPAGVIDATIESKLARVAELLEVK